MGSFFPPPPEGEGATITTPSRGEKGGLQKEVEKVEKMFVIKLPRLVVVTLVSILMPVLALAEWRLAGEPSDIHFVSIKKGTVAEVHRFTELSGGIDAEGNVVVKIPLVSVDTKIPIRDERMREMLFEVDQFPVATISGKVDVKAVSSLTPGKMLRYPAEFTLDLHGQQKTLKGEFVVVGLENSGLAVSSVAPLIVKAADFSLVEGINKLMEVAKLPSIATAVPVTVYLVFNGGQ
jgi:polyisoprenoid-binding protein YceI